MAGDTTASSIIWVPNESTGKDIYGASHALPVDTDTAQIAAAIAAGMTVSGGVPVGAPTGKLPLHLNTLTQKMSSWDGASWITVSGA